MATTKTDFTYQTMEGVWQKLSHLFVGKSKKVAVIDRAWEGEIKLKENQLILL